MSDDLPGAWCRKEGDPGGCEVCAVQPLSGTPYDPYRSYGDKASKGAYRSIGINRNDLWP